MIKFLETERLILSPLSVKDIGGDYLSWINSQTSDIHTQHAVFPHNDVSLLENFKSRAISSNSSIWLGVFNRETEEHIGNIDISGINWINRTGVYNIIIGQPAYQNKGFGFEASVALLYHVFNRLNLNRVQLGVELSNTGAISLYEKLGFVAEGILKENVYKNAVFSDTLIMALLNKRFNEKFILGEDFRIISK